MTRLIVTADLHGSYGTWLALTARIAADDGLVIAGDLFDTRYGESLDIDYQPWSIRAELLAMERPVYYVYGNCDEEYFFPGAAHELAFTFQGRRIQVRHGHQSPAEAASCDILIEGHRHVPQIATCAHGWFLNPGSPVYPRQNHQPTYGVIDTQGIRIHAFGDQRLLQQMTFI